MERYSAFALNTMSTIKSILWFCHVLSNDLFRGMTVRCRMKPSPNKKGLIVLPFKYNNSNIFEWALATKPLESYTLPNYSNRCDIGMNSIKLK